MSASRSNRVIGGGLLRLLADTSVLLYKTRHICWRANGPLQAGLRAVIQEDHASLSDTADEIARHITELGVEIPPDFTALAAMSSIKPTDDLGTLSGAVARIARDHEAVVADIETLRVTLPLEDEPKAAALLERLAKHHACCTHNLKRCSPSTEDGSS